MRKPYRAGDTIADKYQVVRQLGEGALGAVYLVYSAATQSPYALKAVREELASSEAAREHLRAAAQTWIDLERHPYLVRAFSLDEVQGGRHLVAMDFIGPDERGLNSLEGYLRRHSPDLEQSLRWAVQICHGMEHAHARGMRWHGDLKPSNVLIAQDGAVRVSDLGLAISGFGSPTHMPPEQFVDAAACDERSDLYAFGVVLFQIVSGGRLPFVPPAEAMDGPDRASRFWSAMQQLHREAPVPHVDSLLAAAIRRCLEKAPGDRYAGFAEVRVDLEDLLKRETGIVIGPPQPPELEAWEWSNKGLGLQAMDRSEEAIACYDRALATSPGLASAHNNKGNALARLGHFDDAIASFDRAIELDVRYAAPWANKGLILVRLGQDQDALQCFEHSVLLDPRAADAWANLGVVHGRLGRPQQAMKCYDKALEVDPRHGLAWFNKGNALARAGRREEALVAVERGLDANPAHAAGWVAKAVLLNELDRTDEALEAFDRALGLDAASAEAWYNKGNILVHAQRTVEALDCFDNAVRLQPGLALAWNNKALAELRLGRGADAAESLRRFLSLVPSDHGLRPQAEMLLGDLEASADGADSALPEAIHRQPIPPPTAVPEPSASSAVADPPPHASAPTPVPAAAAASQEAPTPVARPAAAAAPPAEAEAARRGAAATGEPTTPKAWNDRGAALFKAGRVEEAKACFDRSLALDPRSGAAWATPRTACSSSAVATTRCARTSARSS